MLNEVLCVYAISRVHLVGLCVSVLLILCLCIVRFGLMLGVGAVQILFYITLRYGVFTLHYVTVCLHYITLRCVYISLRYGVFTFHYVTVCLHYITLRCVYSARSKWAKLPAEKPQINFPKRSDISPCKYLNYSLIRAILPSPPFSSTSSSSPSSSVFHPTNNFAKKINEA